MVPFRRGSFPVLVSRGIFPVPPALAGAVPARGRFCLGFLNFRGLAGLVTSGPFAMGLRGHAEVFPQPPFRQDPL